MGDYYVRFFERLGVKFACLLDLRHFGIHLRKIRLKLKNPTELT